MDKKHEYICVPHECSPKLEKILIIRWINTSQLFPQLPCHHPLGSWKKRSWWQRCRWGMGPEIWTSVDCLWTQLNPNLSAGQTNIKCLIWHNLQGCSSTHLVSGWLQWIISIIGGQYLVFYNIWLIWMCSFSPAACSASDNANNNNLSSVQFNRSVVSDSLWSHESQHTRPPCPWPTPGVHSTQVHRVSDAIQPSHPLSSPSPPAPNPSQHQSLFQWVNSSHEVAKGLEFQL